MHVYLYVHTYTLFHGVLVRLRCTFWRQLNLSMPYFASPIINYLLVYTHNPILPPSSPADSSKCTPKMPRASTSNNREMKEAVDEYIERTVLQFLVNPSLFGNRSYVSYVRFLLTISACLSTAISHSRQDTGTYPVRTRLRFDGTDAYDEDDDDDWTW